MFLFPLNFGLCVSPACISGFRDLKSDVYECETSYLSLLSSPTRAQGVAAREDMPPSADKPTLGWPPREEMLETFSERERYITALSHGTSHDSARTTAALSE